MIQKMIPALKDYLWGGKKLKTFFGRKDDGRIAESWEFSVHPAGESKTVEGQTLSEYVKENNGSIGKGGEFPVLIKFIDAEQNLSVQVHPNDEFARAYENDNGKTEAWYVVSAGEGAGIYCGFKRDTDEREFLNKVKDGTVEELLNFIPVKAGDCFLIEAGTVHAIGAGCLICEVQQNSNVTYRVHDYNRKGTDGKPRDLHVEKAVKVIDFKHFEDKTHGGEYKTVGGGKIRLLTSCKYFTSYELVLDGVFDFTCKDSFLALNFLSGSGNVNGSAYAAGDSFFLPAGEPLRIDGDGTVVITKG